MNIHKILSSCALLLACSAHAQTDVNTHRQYLSGHGCDDMVQWDFFCTDGFNSGKWTKIGVPSCWELQGFGTYQYGMKFYGKAFPDGIADEKGKYKYEFKLPQQWAGRHIDLVFEAVMTDVEVQINHRKAGQKHQGAFYRITYDISDRVFFGDKKNLLELTVSKESENAGVNLSERRADYWNFGGIIRPVFIVSKPALCIERTAIDARADGSFRADVIINRALEGATLETTITDINGKKVAQKTTASRGGTQVSVALSANGISTWTAETPNRYIAEFTLKDRTGKILHVEREKFGFRTIETRPGDGLYINGQKVLVKGVNRHSFRPETGRTLSYAKNLEDVLLIKSLNMNAVRLSHYPADPEFYDICDSLGLYVMDELSGWHGHHETINGQKLIREMVCRDVNHPSIIWWSNGNEKGWNDELNDEFHKYDIQRRPVLHPQGNFGGYETMHYRSYGESNDYMRKHEIWMPTEFLHALYDGGAGAGLYDYWEVMRSWPRCAGGFIWALVDEGVVRTDMGGIIDNVGNYGADGIVGPHHEKEGSYYTVRQVWSPIQIFTPDHNFHNGELCTLETLSADFDGTLNVENRYDFLSLDNVTFQYQYVSYDGRKTTVRKSGNISANGIAPHSSGTLSVPLDKDADALTLTAFDSNKQEIYSRTWTQKRSRSIVSANKRAGLISKTETSENIIISAAKTTYTFSKTNGRLTSVEVDGKQQTLTNGPQFFAYKRADRSMDQFYNHDDPQAEKKKTTYVPYPDLGTLSSLSVNEGNDTIVLTVHYALGSLSRVCWHIGSTGVARIEYVYNFNGVVDLMGISFDLDEASVISKEWLGMGPYRVWKNRLHGPQTGIWQTDYNDPVPGESFTYPEFKGYFAAVQWMQLKTSKSTICIEPGSTVNDYVGVFRPRDGRDELLYTLPQTGLSIMQVIPAVRNKVNTTDLNGPSALPVWSTGEYKGSLTLWFE